MIITRTGWGGRSVIHGDKAAYGPLDLQHFASYQDVHNLYGIFGFNFRINISAESITQVANNKSWRFRSLSLSSLHLSIYLSILRATHTGCDINHSAFLYILHFSYSFLFIPMLFVVINGDCWLADAKCPAVSSCALCSNYNILY